MSVYWRECVSCDGPYLPSPTSHPTECGICAPLKNKRMVVRDRWRDYYDGPLPVVLLEKDRPVTGL